MKISLVLSILLSYCFVKAQFSLQSLLPVEPMWGNRTVFGTNAPGSRYTHLMVTSDDGRHIWMGLGQHTTSSFYGDIWLYDTHTELWAWMLGNNFLTPASADMTYIAGTTLDYPVARGSVVSWLDHDSNLWIYGGLQGTQQAKWFFADLWKLNLSNVSDPYWSFITGDNPMNPSVTLSNYGNQPGVPMSSVYPGGRSGSVSWVDSQNNLYLFGGVGYADSVQSGYLGDMWMYSQSTGWWAYMGGPKVITVSSGYSYGKMGVPSADNWPPHRSGAVSWVFGNSFYMLGGSFYEISFLGDTWKWENSTWTWIGGQNIDDEAVAAECGNLGYWSDRNHISAITQAVSWQKDDSVWIFGGNIQDTTYAASNRIWIFNNTNLKWTCLNDTQSISARSLASAVYLNKTVYVYGGIDQFGGATDSFSDLWTFDMNSYNFQNEVIETNSSSVVSEKTSNATTIAVAVVVPIIVVILGIFALLFLWKHKKNSSQEKTVPLDTVAVQDNLYSPLSRTSTVAKETVQIEVSTLLGIGNFGEVYKGKRNGVDVALKKLKSADGWAEFQKEVNVLCALHHKNIVQYLGVHKSPEGECYIITELMTRGDLKKVLMEQKDSLTIKGLLFMAQDAAQGMIFIHANNYIHRDLALRNLLATEGGSEGRKFTVKVSDFGMAKLLTDSNYYTSESNHHPIKWCAIETLKFGKYSVYSDLWSFGILLWELFSSGAAPYGGRTNVEVCDAVMAGYRLEKPNACPEEIYSLMLQCWKEVAKERPTMVQIEEQIAKCLSEQ